MSDNQDAIVHPLNPMSTVPNYSATQDNDLRKALSTSVADTGAALIPEVVSEGLRRFVITRSPLYAEMPKRNWPTNAYLYREVNALPTAAFAADGAALPSATRGTYAKRTTAMKFIYTRGEVTGPMISASGSLIDALQTEIEIHGDALVRTIEQKIISGNSTTSADEFDGLVAQITTNVKDYTASSNPVLLTLSHMDETLDTPLEYPSHVVLSRAMGRRLWSLLQAQQRFLDRTEVAGGFRVPVYNDLPILRVDNNISGLTNTILFPDMRFCVMAINQDITFEPLAKTKDSQDFMLKMYATLAVEGEALYHAKMVGVKAS